MSVWNDKGNHAWRIVFAGLKSDTVVQIRARSSCYFHFTNIHTPLYYIVYLTIYINLL